MPLRVINIIPQQRSGETNFDSEPSIAVNPSNPQQIVATSFTPDTGPIVTTGPYWFSADGGTTWAQNSVIQGGTVDFGTKDISIRFASSSGVLYAGILRGDSSLRLNILRKANFSGPGLMDVLVDRAPDDQPWVEAATQSGTDRVYVSSNDISQRPTGQTASVEFSLDAATAAAPAGFTPATTARLETRTSAALPNPPGGSQDGPSVRVAIHPSGVLYGAFFGWRTFGTFGSPNVSDIVVVRDDNWASGATQFQALVDPVDNLAGLRVVTGVSIGPLNTFLGTQRIGSSLSIAVDPGDAQRVYLAWCDGLATAASPYTLRVRRSDDGGQNWTGDLLTVPNATNQGLAVNERGTVALLYQQFAANVSGTDRWRTHLVLSTDQFATVASDTTLADVVDSDAGSTITVIIGDYDNLIAVGNDFYGIFSAQNAPALGNFPAGVTYLRNANFATQQLLDVDNITPVSVSVDPFFFHLSEEQPKVQPSSGFAIQGKFGTKGNFEVVAPLQSVRLAHFWRDNDAANLPWHGPTPFGSNDHYHPVALIQSNFSTAGAGPGNLEVVARTGNRLDHYWRDDVNPFPWHGPFAIPGANGVQGPALIQGHFGTKGNFELVAARLAGRLIHFSRDNDAANLPWSGPTLFGSSDHYDAVALIQSNFSTAGGGPGNLEVIAHTGNRLDFYWRDDVNPFPWHGPFAIPGAVGIG
jgi:hypothetical protein